MLDPVCHPVLVRALCLFVAAFLQGWTAEVTHAVAGEYLKITVGESTRLSPVRYQNTSSLSVSSTGVVAAFYTDDEGRLRLQRTSTDRGRSWSAETRIPPEHGGGQCSVLLPNRGGVLRVMDAGKPMDGRPGWFEVGCVHYSSDFAEQTAETLKIHMPGAIPSRVNGRSYVWSWPIMHSRIANLPDGALIGAMYGLFAGDAVGSDRGSRVIAVRSADEGRTWHYRGTVSNTAEDPDPDLPGVFAGFTESTIAFLKNGQLLCMLRSQGSHYPAEYRPLYVSWSDDLGQTWTKPVPTEPHLMNILPTLQVLDNGVVAAIHGRPGFHIAFSLDNGHTWRDRVTFSRLVEPDITGQVDGCKVGPDRLLAIGGVDDGTRMFPVDVQLVSVEADGATLAGEVLDNDGRPISAARVQRTVNRYAALAWREGDTIDPRVRYAIPKASPVLAYQAIDPAAAGPIVETDANGHFQFDGVPFGETIVTVESPGFAPQWRRVQVVPEPARQLFQLEPGRSVRGQVVDQNGRPLPGMCVVVGGWHLHSDRQGHFHWCITGEVPIEATIEIYKRYDPRYEHVRQTIPLVRMAGGTFVVKSSLISR